MSGAARMRLRGPHSVFPILGVTDLAITTLTASELDVAWTPVPNAVSTQIRFRQAGNGAWGDWLDFNVDLLITVEDRTDYQFQLRELNSSNKVGPRSNVVSYETVVPKITIKDVKSFSVQGSGNPATVYAALNLAAMTEGALNFAAGDYLFIFAASHHAATGTVTTAGAATGWTQLFPFAVVSSVISFACNGLWKISDGTETTVAVLTDTAATGTQRATYVAVVVTVTNGAFYVGATALQQATASNPTLQAIAASGATGPALAWSMTANNPGATQTPDYVTYTAAAPYFAFLKNTAGGSVPLANIEVRMKIFPNGETAANFNVDMADQGNNGMASGWFGTVDA